MSDVYRYSIIRFRPFAETGEFANIGILASEVGRGRTEFKLAPLRFGRLKHFFDGVGYEAYRQAIQYLRKELERISKELPLLYGERDREIFYSLAQNRESSILFSEPRIIKSDLILSDLVSNLYERYIDRNFGTAENPESALTRRLRAMLHEKGVRHFRQMRINDEVVPVLFPLAYRNYEFYAIKPISFSQKTPLSVFDHGLSWKNRFEYLLEREKVRPHNVLVTLEPPQAGEDSSFQEAFHLVEHDLKQLPFEVVTTIDKTHLQDTVLSFAKQVPIDRAVWTTH